MLKYTIATGKNATDILTEYGVHVSGSTGLVGRPDFKAPTHRFGWDYLNGEWIDLKARRYKPREIRLRCWMKSDSKQSAIENLNTFLKAFDTDSLIRLHVSFISSDGSVQPLTKGLFFLVYLSDSDIRNVVWRPGRQILSFDITLIEPSPIKRVYQVQGTDTGSVAIRYNSASEFDIHWGDGAVTYDCIGENEASHAYTTTGRHFIIITGVISDIEDMTISASTEITVTQIYDEI